MPPLIDIPQGPTRFAAPLGLAPRRNPDIAFSRMLDALQREQALEFRADQAEADRRQRSGLALQRQIGDTFSDVQRIAARQQEVQAIGDRQQALENLRTQNDLQINADKFYRKNYGKSLDQVQSEAQQAGMPLEEYNHVLNGEQFIVPPENIAQIAKVDQELQALKRDGNFDDSTKFDIANELQERRFQLFRKEWRPPKTKPITEQQMLGDGTRTVFSDGSTRTLTGFDNNKQPKYTLKDAPDDTKISGMAAFKKRSLSDVQALEIGLPTGADHLWMMKQDGTPVDVILNTDDLRSCR